jgi:hypothetical protein
MRSAYEISPEQGNEIANYESEFGCTIKRNVSMPNLIALGRPYKGIENEAMKKLATSFQYTGEIFAAEWVLPMGAYGESCGPL